MAQGVRGIQFKPIQSLFSAITTKKASPSLRFGASAELFDMEDLGGNATKFEDVVILDGRRTPYGDHFGSLKDLNETDLASIATQGVLEATQVNSAKIRDSIWGNVIQSSDQASHISRDAMRRNGGVNGAVSTTINKLCGSGVASIYSAALKVANMKDTAKDYIILAGGTESMTNAPFASFEFMKWFAKAAGKAKAVQKSWLQGGPIRALLIMRNIQKRALQALQQDINSFVKLDGAKSPLQFKNTLREGLSHRSDDVTMIDTAENLRERFQLSAQEIDRYSVLSQHRAAEAIKLNKFADEIVPVKDASGKVVLAKDENVRGTKVNEKSLADLRKRQGSNSKIHFHPKKAVHTAANASRITDGAAAVLVTNIETAQRLGKVPLGKVLAIGEVGVNPTVMGLGAGEAAKAALKASGLDFKDIGLFEVNEAFAGVALSAIKNWSNTYNVPEDEILSKTNVNGGAIALGHPLGSSGTRLTITLLKEMERQNIRYGLATLCIGDGQGIAIVVENPKASVKKK